MEQESVPYAPHPALRPFVAAVVGYRHEGLRPGSHRGLPSPYLTLILTVDEPLRIAAHADPDQAPDHYDALIGGLHTRPALIAHEGRRFGVQISLTPLGSRALLGAPARTLAAVDCHLDDVLGPAGRELIERFREAPGWAGRFAAIEQVLLELVDDGAAHVPPEIREAWRLTTASAGRLRVEEIARRVGWSDRHLLHRFRAETGLSPKEAARVARFDRARRVLAARVAAGGPPDLAGLAAMSGYADQAHLTREWRDFAGLPPTRWLAEEFGFVQDGAASVAAASST